MPYITQEARKGSKFLENGGDLNYEISSLLGRYVEKHGLRYATISDILGALEGAKLEFTRRVINPYEEQKKAENGDLPRYADITANF